MANSRPSFLPFQSCPALAWLFPGQGLQAADMGRDLCYGSGAALQIFETADDVLGYPLTEVCFDGPEDRLRDTRFAQPAIVPHATLLNIGALAEATRAGVTATT